MDGNGLLHTVIAATDSFIEESPGTSAVTTQPEVIAKPMHNPYQEHQNFLPPIPTGPSQTLLSDPQYGQLDAATARDISENLLRNVERSAASIAGELTYITGNLQTALQRPGKATAAHMDLLQGSVEHCHGMTMNAAGAVDDLLVKLSELDEHMKPVARLAGELQDLKSILTQFEQQADILFPRGPPRR